jgi:uncharacterized protein (TIRG00374 family)
VTVTAVGTTSTRGVVVVEPTLPRRARRPADLVRLFLSLVLLAIPLVLGSVAVSTSTGLEQDLLNTSHGLPKLVLSLVSYAAAVATIALPVALGVDMILRRRLWQLMDALVAATIAVVIAYGLRYWIEHAQPGRILEALTKVVNGDTGERSPPIQALLCGIVAFLTLAGLAGRRYWRLGATVAVGSVALFGFLTGRVTALATLVSLVLGWSVGLAVRYAIGAASTRPPGAEVADALVAAHVPIDRLERTLEDSVEPRRYVGHQPDGGLVRVEVLDRDTYGQALLYRLWRRLRVRGPATRRSFLTVRSAIDHVALMVLSAQHAGVHAPDLLAASEVGPYAALVAFRHVPGRGLASVLRDAQALIDGPEVRTGRRSLRDTLTDLGSPPHEEDDGQPTMRAADVAGIDDDLLRRAWLELRKMQERRLVHRGLTADNLLLMDDGGVAFLDLASGEIAASDVAIRLDTVQMLATLGLVVGPERAVRTAVEVLGANAVVDALPLLQRIALSRQTRKELKRHKRLMHDLRAQIIDVTPADPDVEEIKLERLSMRTLIAVIGGAVAAYVILTQFTQIDFGSLADVNWAWAAAAFAFSILTFVAAGMTCVGFVTTKISLFRATLAQYAVGFSGLLAPTAVGTVAINVRFLERSGVDPAVAVSSVGLVQLVMFVGHIVLLVLFGVLAGTGAEESFTPPAGAVIAVLVVLILALIGLSLPLGRRLLQQRVSPLVRRVIPQLIAVFQRPRKIALGVGGALLLNLAYIAALDAAVRAFGHSMAFATVAVVYLAGSVVGSAVPTPGGIGAIEVAMAAGLSATGLPAGVALSTVLLYRIATFWIPIPIGWASLTWLQKVGSL